MRLISVSIVATLLSVPVFGASITDFSLLLGCWSGPIQGGGTLLESYSASSQKMISGQIMVLNPDGTTSPFGSVTLEEKTANDTTFTLSERGNESIYSATDFDKFGGKSFVAGFTNPNAQSGTSIILTVKNNKTYQIRVFGAKGGGFPNDTYDLPLARVSKTPCSSRK